MKKFLAATLCLVFVFFVSAQNILVADNNPGAPSGTHVYPSLADAVLAAQAGDIIHLIPSASTYGTVEITAANDSISIFGVGFKPDKDGPQVAVIDNLRISGNGIRVSGVQVTGRVYINWNTGSYTGFTLENSRIGYIQSNSAGTFSNVLIRSCIINRDNATSGLSVNFTTAINNSVIANCIIEGWESTGTVYESVEAFNGTIIRNCIFYGNGSAAAVAFEDMTNCTVSNCIFFGRAPYSNGGTFENNVFNNNVAVGTNNDALPPAGTGSGNTGTGNFTAVTDPATIFGDAGIAVGANWSLNWDPTVVEVSLVAGGTDGTDVGVEGSTIPYSVTGTPLPIIKRLIVPEVIKQGDNLNTTIEAVGN